MNKNELIRFVCMVFIVFSFTTCNNFTDSRDPQLADLQKYQNIGAGVAEREWTEDYDCSNFSTQFYQNCYQAGLPCRVRFGRSGGKAFSSSDHAWNSVKIDGTWVNWEPQLNAVYNDHRQTRTPMGAAWGDFVEEDISRIIYETIGKYVPKSVIDSYEIDAYWSHNSPFYPYFISHSYCLSDEQDQDTQSFVLDLQSEIPDNNSGDIFIVNRQHIFLFFKYENKYYGIANLEESDPVEGRSVQKHDTLKEIISANSGFTKLEIDLYYEG
jgi:hypothetical protein